MSCTITSCLEQHCGHISLCAQCSSVRTYLSFPRAPSLPLWLPQLLPPPGDSSVVQHDACWAGADRCALPRYTVVAQELVVRSRGVLKERGWRLPNDKLGSGDDISVFVIPLGGPGNYM